MQNIEERIQGVYLRANEVNKEYGLLKVYNPFNGIYEIQLYKKEGGLNE